MKILVLGAGAIGGYYGARLIEAGAEVTFVVRPTRKQLLDENGLIVESGLGDFRRPVQAVTAETLKRKYDLILLTCKGYDLPAALDTIAPAVGERTGILPFVNGMSAYDRLDAQFGKARVLGGVAYIAVNLDHTGVIRHQGVGDVVTVGARSDSMRVLANDFYSLLVDTPGTRNLSQNIEQALWDKWTFLTAGALMTCLMRGTIGEIMGTSFGKALMTRAIAECRGVRAGMGYDSPDSIIASMYDRLFDQESEWAASMARDITRGVNQVEADDIVGDMARRAERMGLDAPLTQAAYCNLQVYLRQKSVTPVSG